MHGVNQIGQRAAFKKPFVALPAPILFTTNIERDGWYWCVKSSVRGSRVDRHCYILMYRIAGKFWLIQILNQDDEGNSSELTS